MNENSITQREMKVYARAANESKCSCPIQGELMVMFNRWVYRNICPHFLYPRLSGIHVRWVAFFDYDENCGMRVMDGESAYVVRFPTDHGYLPARTYSHWPDCYTGYKHNLVQCEMKHCEVGCTWLMYFYVIVTKVWMTPCQQYQISQMWIFIICGTQSVYVHSAQI